MRMTELLFNEYVDRAKGDTFSEFIKRCRQEGDRMSSYVLAVNGVSSSDILEEVQLGLIEYNPHCGLTKKLTGYSLTLKGMREIYSRIQATQTPNRR